MTEPKEQELKPCPFCGSTKVEAVAFDNAVVLPFDDGKMFRTCVLCRNCKTIGTLIEKPYPVSASEMVAITHTTKATWNRRAIDPAPAPQWTSEVPQKNGIYAFVSGDDRQFGLVIKGDLFIIFNKRGYEISLFVERFKPIWYPIPEPPLPAEKEDTP